MLTKLYINKKFPNANDKFVILVKTNIPTMYSMINKWTIFLVTVTLLLVQLQQSGKISFVFCTFDF